MNLATEELLRARLKHLLIVIRLTRKRLALAEEVIEAAENLKDSNTKLLEALSNYVEAREALDTVEEEDSWT